MSAWQYQECPNCGEEVKARHTCAEWNKKLCEGDPWGESLRRTQESDLINKIKEGLLVSNIDNNQTSKKEI